ncbi:hypothetical protein FACS1894219_08610 [Clostridia bacterium]|nr:hypothetical protein FACS1894219_08610 [Clostridia bacterium]
MIRKVLPKMSLALAMTVLLSVSVFAVAPGSSDGYGGTTVSTDPASPVDVTDTTTGVTVEIPENSLSDGVTAVTLETDNLSLTSDVAQQVESSIETYLESSISALESFVAENGGNSSDYTPAVTFETSAGDTVSYSTIALVSVFELNLSDQNGSYIHNFNNTITVTIPAPAGANAVAYFDSTTGALVIQMSSLRNGFISFTTNHFSYYTLLKVEEVALTANVIAVSAKDIVNNVNTPNYTSGNTVTDVAVTPDAKISDSADEAATVGDTGVKANTPIKPNPQTSDFILVFVLLGSAAFAGSAAIIIRKRQNNAK